MSGLIIQRIVFASLTIPVLATACQNFDWTQKPKEKSDSASLQAPANGATGVALNPTIEVRFTAAANTATVAYNAANGTCTGTLQISTDNFASCRGIISAVWSEGNTLVSLTLSVGLPPKASTQVRLVSGITTTEGKAISTGFVGAFTTQGDAWITKAAVPTIRNGGMIAANGKVYLMGSHASLANEAYDPATNTWAARAPLPADRSEFGIATYNNKIYVIGGCSPGCPAQNAVYEYDTISNTWTNCGGTCASMPTARYAFGAAEANGKIYAFGGYNGSFLTLVQEYNIGTNTWTNCGGSCPSMAFQREGATAVYANGKIYVMGGAWTPDFVTWNYPEQVEEFDPNTYTWVTKAATGTYPGHKPLGLGEIGGKVYVVWGQASTTQFFEYDTVANTFTARAPKVSGIGSYGAGVLNGRFYVVHGTTGAFEEYTPP